MFLAFIQSGTAFLSATHMDYTFLLNNLLPKGTVIASDFH